MGARRFLDDNAFIVFGVAVIAALMVSDCARGGERSAAGCRGRVVLDSDAGAR